MGVKNEMSEPDSCPFHFDLIIAYHPKRELAHGEEEADASDEDEEQKDSAQKPQMNGNMDHQNPDLIGDLIKKLEANNLRYVVKMVSEISDKPGRGIGNVFKEFATKAKYENKQPRHKRFLALIDRRQRVENEENNDTFKIENERLIMFEPPIDAGRDIPKDAVSEYSMCASSICVIPNEKYEVSKLMTEMPPEQKDSAENALNGNMMEKILKEKITCKTGGAFLTLSFHVKTEECIKAYLFINGQYTRFAPSDIVNILPNFFVPNKTNQGFVEGEKEKQRFTNLFKKQIVDRDFDAFRAAVKNVQK